MVQFSGVGSEYLKNFYYQMYQDGNWNWLSKINILYTALNFLGYWQDEKLDVKRKFIPSLNDGSHAYYASFGNLFVTKDERFAKKLQAVYSHYNINTIVCHYTDSKE